MVAQAQSVMTVSGASFSARDRFRVRPCSASLGMASAQFNPECAPTAAHDGDRQHPPSISSPPSISTAWLSAPRAAPCIRSCPRSPCREFNMANKMLIDASHPEETRVVVVRGQKVEEFDFESASRRQLRGNIYLAKVTRVEPSLQAAFVEYGGNRHGFLAFSEIHPDYYQIPVADRQALLEADADAQREEEREEERRRAAAAAALPPVRPQVDEAVTSAILSVGSEDAPSASSDGETDPTAAILVVPDAAVDDESAGAEPPAPRRQPCPRTTRASRFMPTWLAPRPCSPKRRGRCDRGRVLRREAVPRPADWPAGTARIMTRIGRGRPAEDDSRRRSPEDDLAEDDLPEHDLADDDLTEDDGRRRSGRGRTARGARDRRAARRRRCHRGHAPRGPASSAASTRSRR